VDEPPIRIHLSPPDVGEAEREALLAAFDSGWIAPLGPDVDAFEAEVAARVGAGHAVALSSGTAALHLALLLAGVGPGDRVLCPSMTFVATANPIRYLGAEPVFVDSSATSWNVDAELVAGELDAAARRGERYAAVVTVDLYGWCCDYEVLERVCAEHEVPLIEDAAEALGSAVAGRAAGTFGAFGVLSFNGNKIATTSGGGMLLTDDVHVAERARFLATQARDRAPHYQHSELGFNYRLSNLLAALGRVQVRDLDARIARRQRIAGSYRERLGDLAGFTFPAPPSGQTSNAWLTCVTIDPQLAGVDREDVRRHLRAQGIEARPLWKPMHLQPLYEDAFVVGGAASTSWFERGLCLPSGSSLRVHELDEVCQGVRAAVPQGCGSA
jgi:dTDP-4-amino-4,6-dideoxygalactose transaminase